MCLVVLSYLLFFFFKQKTAYEMRISDWSSDVCSSDLPYADSSGKRRHPLGRLPSAFAIDLFAPDRSWDSRSMSGPLLKIIARDTSFAYRSGGAWLPVAFLLMVATLFPLAVGPDTALPQRTGGGVTWTIGRASCREGGGKSVWYSVVT